MPCALPELGSFDTSSLRVIHLGGAASSPELIARLEAAFHCQALAGYGLTETSPVATSARDKSTVTFADEEDRLRHRAATGGRSPESNSASSIWRCRMCRATARLSVKS